MRVFTEQQIVSSATASEIDMEAFQSFMRAQGKQTEDDPQPETDDDLRNASVCGDLDGVLRPTLYGLMVFGRGPQRYPRTLSLFVQCARYAGLDRAAEAVSVGEAKGRLEDQVDRAVGWFRSLGRGERYNGLHREDLPLMPEHVPPRGGRERRHPPRLCADRITCPPGGIQRPNRGDKPGNAAEPYDRRAGRRGRRPAVPQRDDGERDGCSPPHGAAGEGLAADATRHARVQRDRARAHQRSGRELRAGEVPYAIRNGYRERQMNDQSANDHGSPVTFRFSNIGPVKEATLQLGRLTVIAGRNNTGKTYIAYSLYGFLKMWRGAVAAYSFRLVPKGAIRDAADMFRRCERATVPLPSSSIGDQRNILLKELGARFSHGLPGVFSSRSESFRGSSLAVELDATAAGQSPSSMEAPIGGTGIAMEHDGVDMVMSVKGSERQLLGGGLEPQLAEACSHFLLHDLFPDAFILSAERFGISLFYRELDFTKNQLVDMLQKLGDQGPRRSISPYLIIRRTTSRYALPIKDNIDFTRSIPDLPKDGSALVDDKLFDDVKNLVGGYYGNATENIRFISKARGKGRSFNIPLHLASSSARGLSDLYFYLRHTAARDQLLIIDEPESHLDTRNPGCVCPDAGEVRHLRAAGADHDPQRLYRQGAQQPDDAQPGFPGEGGGGQEAGLPGRRGSGSGVRTSLRGGGRWSDRVRDRGVRDRDAGLRRDDRRDQRGRDRAVVACRGGLVMERVTLADQIAPIIKDGALVPIKDGRVELREPKVMTVVVAGLPDCARVINMRKIGRAVRYPGRLLEAVVRLFAGVPNRGW